MQYLLDHRVTIQRGTETASIYNEMLLTWSDLVTVWAHRIDASVGEQSRAAEVMGKITAHFIVRYSTVTASIVPKDRLVLGGGPTYNILGIRELERNRWLEIHCAAVQE